MAALIQRRGVIIRNILQRGTQTTRLQSSSAATIPLTSDESSSAQTKSYSRELFGCRSTKNKNNHQNGYGKIVAVSSKDATDKMHTHFTELRHASPMRLVPSRRTNSREGALLHLSSYGGGLVPGDSLYLDVDVRGKGAMLAVMTQGGQRIYRPGEQLHRYDNYKHDTIRSTTNDTISKSKSSHDFVCQSTIKCTIEPGATLFYLPDPTVPYRSSSFEERRIFHCQNSSTSASSIIAVDWYSSGRTFSSDIEERWAFNYLATRTELFITDQPNTRKKYAQPTLIESMSFGNKGVSEKSSPPAATAMGESFDAMATLLLSGPTSTPVVKRALELERKIAASLTRIRRDSSESDEEGTGDIDAGLVDLINSLGGQVLLSVTPVEHHDTTTQQKQLHMVRIIAGSNEDIYRILHYCLKDCSVHFGGLEPYKERIHSSKTVRQKNIPLVMQQQQQQTERWRNKGKDLQSVVEKLGLIPAQDNNDAWFRLCTLSDSALPIGSFAHSQGIEAASQMQLFKRSDHSNNRAEPCSIDALSDFIYSISRSNARFSTPLIMAGYSLIQQSTTENSLPVKETLQLWSEIDAYTDTMLLTNRPGRRASIDQGLGLVRIASSFANDRNDKHDLNPDIATDLWTLISQSIDNNDERSMAKGHAAPIYGILSATLGITPLDCCRVFAFGATRDAVSAAVRLNLIGPMAGLTLLDKVGRKAVEDGLEEGLIGMLQSSRDLSPDEFSSQARIKYWLQSVHTCAPVLDASQPLADILSVRLFRT